jgi:hypothetical protein
MIFQRPTQTLDTSLFDPDHDLDLVAMLNNARTEHELAAATRASHARLRARHAAVKTDSARRSRRAASGRTASARA